MKRGFTLIELLVVIAIIAILAAILFPVFAKAREKARQVSCQSNLKQLALGMLMYSQDYDEILPGWTLGSCSKGNMWFWKHLLYPYVKNHQLFICPSSRWNYKATCDLFHPLANAMNLPSSYGVNDCWDGNGDTTLPQHLGLASIIRPAELFMIGEGNVAWRPLSRSDPNNLSCSANYPAVHNDGINVAYCDGHVKWLRRDRAYNSVQANVKTYLPWRNADAYAPGY